MFFKYVDAADIRWALFALRFELKDKASALFKQGIPSHLACDLSICLSTVEYVWGLNNRKFKWFKEHTIAYLRHAAIFRRYVDDYRLTM